MLVSAVPFISNGITFGMAQAWEDMLVSGVWAMHGWQHSNVRLIQENGFTQWLKRSPTTMTRDVVGHIKATSAMEEAERFELQRQEEKQE